MHERGRQGEQWRGIVGRFREPAMVKLTGKLSLKWLPQEWHLNLIKSLEHVCLRDSLLVGIDGVLISTVQESAFA